MRQGAGQAQALEGGLGVESQDLGRETAGIEPQQDRDQPTDDVGVGIASEHQPPVRRTTRNQPHLARATANLVGVRAFLLSQRLERAPEFDDVAIAFFPIPRIVSRAQHVELVSQLVQFV